MNLERMKWFAVEVQSGHAGDMDTRFIELNFTKTTDSLNITAPANSNIAPGGFYMMFIINSEGVPSAAKMVKIS